MAPRQLEAPEWDGVTAAVDRSARGRGTLWTRAIDQPGFRCDFVGIARRVGAAMLRVILGIARTYICVKKPAAIHARTSPMTRSRRYFRRQRVAREVTTRTDFRFLTQIK